VKGRDCFAFRALCESAIVDLKHRPNEEVGIHNRQSTRQSGLFDVDGNVS
jgi:hypothetical protein